MLVKNSLVSRRTFVGGSAVIAAVASSAALLSGCSSSSKSSSASSTSAGSSTSASSGAAPTIVANDEMEELNTVLLGKDSKIACIIVANKRGYYTDEKLTLNTQVVSGGFPEAMPMLSDGTVDVLPFGSIPSCTYIGQGDDLVIFGGTVTNGSECVTLIENKDNYKKAEDFKGKKIACFRMETGHMVTKSWLRSQGLTIGNSPEDVESGKADVAFILLENAAAEVAAVENGEVDMCFVNSGYGYVATKGGKCAIAFQPQELIGHEFPCCRQTTNRTAFEDKKSQLLKFEIANIRAMYDIANDKEGVIKDIMDYSGQDEDYVTAITYGNGDYVAAMQFEMDPRTSDVYAFYGDMIANGDIEYDDQSLILEHMDSTIYKAALDTLIERGENVDFYKGLLAKYEKNNTMGV
ncbi:MAG: ABC transporter substrate-binding protein [Eggerthellaceae bacterium]|nr:ABC transporter substrate-binding protein [Eggerthellaceae bacterium]